MATQMDEGPFNYKCSDKQKGTAFLIAHAKQQAGLQATSYIFLPVFTGNEAFL